MKKYIEIVMLVLVIVVSSCGTGTDVENDVVNQLDKVDKDKFLIDLAELETKLNVDTPIKEDLQKAVTVFQDFAGYFPEDDKAPDYLLKASDIALTLGQNEKSVKILVKIIDNYPSYEKIEAVYYNRASHTDFELRDTTLAKQYYLEFMEKFPESDFNDDAQARLDQNFMSLDELMEMFMKNAESELAQ